MDCLSKPHANYVAVTGEPEGVLLRANQGYGLGDQGTARINATLLSLVRAMQDLERTWNSKFNYPWTFFNDVPFTDEFKQRTQAETKAECRYGEARCWNIKLASILT
jgi:mannosyltransferase